MHFVFSGVFKKFTSSIEALIEKDVSTNKAVSTLLGCRLNACRSHPSNFAVNDLLSEHKPVVFHVHFVMVKRRAFIPAAKLRQYIPLRPILDSPTRGSSTFSLSKVYQKIREFLLNLNVRNISIILPSLAKEKKLDNIFEWYGEVESIYKRLQGEDRTESDVRILFDTVKVKHLHSTARLIQLRATVRQSDFENGVFKLQENRRIELWAGKSDALYRLKISSRGSSVDANESPSFEKHAIKIRHLKVLSVDLPIINIVERLMSDVCWVLKDRRQQILPVKFDQQLVL